MAHNESAAFFVDDILARPLINHSEQPELFSVSSESIGNEMHYAIMMRKNDPQFVTFVDSTLKDFLPRRPTCNYVKWLSPGPAKS